VADRVNAVMLEWSYFLCRIQLNWMENGSMWLTKDGILIGRQNWKRVGGDPENEADHFIKCPACGQMIDRRDLGEVFHHELEGHEPLPTQ
jgi:hypothetical protein